ncbi:adventurous gliding motility protein CglF [Anaeromyxobacter oryzisoli]|uniref:adventurous gliding motility protein CglF n=1 Tax=Anaeromyxobacter oryzisoli TaxID=2925408 RepID=UPI001F55C97C|nr:adventurous gliding motility protein CglF [Anaeromyxobacter sp. SG63]
MRTVVLTMALVLPLVAAGQSAGGKAEGQPQPKVEYEKKTVINFEDDTIEGDLKRPDGEYVEARRKVDHSNLIKIRENWRDKVMQASGDL